MTKAWDEHRKMIIGEYKDNGRPLHEVQRIMEEKYRFKASTRAYRSRLDKWGVYKYSCRKRKNSVTGNDRVSSDLEDAAAISPPRTPRPRRGDGVNSPSDSMSPVSPTQVQDHQFFSSAICTSTPPSDIGSPGSPPIKFEAPQPAYHSQHLAPPPLMRHAVSLPNPGYLDQQFRYQYPHPAPSQHHQQPQQQQSHFGPHTSFYRQNTQGQIYHQLQGPGPMDLAMASAPLPLPPSQSGFSQLQHPHHFPATYHGYAMSAVGMKSSPDEDCSPEQ